MSRGDDVLSAAAFAVLGSAIVIASWRMERLEKLGINPWSAPGLTPGIIGALMIVFAAVLAWQPRRGQPAGEATDATPSSAPSAGSAGRSLLAVGLCGLFAGASLGHGLPFGVEAAVFIFVFTTLFSWHDWLARGRVARGLLRTLVIAGVAAAGIAWLFESVFLVRLP
jgi:putative tricarboxylic transport membrane protein